MFHPIVIIVLVLLLLGAIPLGRRNRRYGIGLGGLITTLLIIFLILFLLGAI